MKRVLLALATLTIIMVAGCSKKAPTDEEVNALYEALAPVAGSLTMPNELIDRQVCRIIDSMNIDIHDLSVSQIRRAPYYRMLRHCDTIRSLFRERLNTLAKARTEEGAVAAMLAAEYYYPQGHAEEYALKLAKHPHFHTLIADSVDADEAMAGILVFEAESDISPEITSIVLPIITANAEKLPDDAFKKAMNLFKSAISEENLDPEIRENARLALLARNERLREEGAVKHNGALTSYANDFDKVLNSAIAKGELIGYDAPEIDFIWSSDGKSKHLSDFKGKVVILDFWATWCGPCFRAFPNIRELQARYKDYDVVILGVTSIQNRHTRRYPDGHTEPIVTQGEPEKEFALMKEFMDENDMTWKVVFSDESCFNPDYGVFGIPHVAIIDTKGKVRYNGLRPYDAPFHEAEKIDALLLEGGKKAPAEPMVTTNFAK